MKKFIFLVIFAFITYTLTNYYLNNQKINMEIFYSEAETAEGEHYSFRSHFHRDLYKNFRRDFSIDATCTLPYVSRSCYNLISDYIYDDKVKNVEPVSKLKSGDVIMVSTNQCEEFFRKIFPKITSYIILISHNSDDPLDSKQIKYLEEKKLIAWFASNPNFNHSKLIPLPIGFEDTNWNPEKTKMKFVRKVNFKSLIPWKERKYLVYINFEPGIGVRRKARAHLKDFFKNFSNFFIEGRSSGSNIDYPTYLERLANSKYVLCPR